MLVVNGKELETDKDGYLVHYLDWSEDVAQVIAKDLGLE